ncbi:MAG: LysR family transcriptional regulator [Rhodocyclaceae bacterium]|nr:MAG: LysR family transcriptional regulator [Rhodocyclaceae bacterium]
MNRTEEINAFVVSVESGGFSAAARKLGLTPSALSKLVSRLEDRLGSRLLHRTTRRLQLTAEGETFFNRVRPVLAALDDAEAEIREASASPRGLLRMRCGSVFAVHQLTRAIPRFLEQHPGIALDLIISDVSTSASDEHVDLAIQIGMPAETTAVVRRICNVTRIICAAPAYVEKFGMPQTPDDLHQHNCLWITSLPALRRWSFDTDEGIRVVPIDGNVIANNAEMVLQLALAGVGITCLSDVVVGESIRRGLLVPVLAAWHHVEAIPLVASYPSSRNLSPKVRAMVDFLVSEFGHAPWRQSSSG